MFVAIRFATVKPGFYRWLTALSFKPGDGLRVAKMQSGADLAKAQRFSLAQAREIALQFYHLQAAICHPVTGAVLAEETAALKALVEAKREESVRQAAEWREQDRAAAQAFEAALEASGIREIIEEGFQDQQGRIRRVRII